MRSIVALALKDLRVLAIWRGFTFGEMLLPCAILLGFGAVCFAVGVRGLREG